ncbi:MaoC family dehydratase [Nitriliruptor alkaliphilus]|uniref:MaoC family dehydratase n=1 Tax=Nitriliruptor alkaliphilus TaxID=427918 RepID=UPI0006963517|nr:MaoC family dehydratase [Nitriliruptor alkaliphilus]
MSADGFGGLEVGTSLGTSDWVTIDQGMIDAHADTTGDRDWIHNDVDRATREGPFGAPIAQGSLLIGNLVRMQEQVVRATADVGLAYALNYGFDRVRFVHPVRAGERIRAHLQLADLRPRDDGARVVTLEVTVEIEGRDRPAVVAAWLGLLPT